jgi:hypothetical protein
MKRYSIRGHRYGERNFTEIAQCDSNPREIAAAARAQRISIGFTRGGAPIRISKFDRVHIVENDDPPNFAANAREETAGNSGTAESAKHHGNTSNTCT